MGTQAKQPTADEAVKRFVKACQEIDKENAKSIFNLNSAVSVWTKAQGKTGEDERQEEILSKYRDIPETVIKSIKGLVEHNRRLHDILYKGSGEDTQTLEEYKAEKEKFWSDLHSILKGDKDNS